MSKFSMLLKLARRVGPTVALVAARYGPQIRQIIKENPEAFERITGQFKKAITARSNQNKKPQGLDERLALLREQVTYLYASANNAEVAHQASAWRKEIEKLERSVPLLNAMGRKQHAIQKRKMEMRIDRLSSQILAASLVDDIEDAEFSEGGESAPQQ
ncbi:MAG: hypothetical protein IKZ87_03725 [Actinomycetaceae bacterium]|nr:hypothetical protein [Actinomycetaceae bacterium]